MKGRDSDLTENTAPDNCLVDLEELQEISNDRYLCCRLKPRLHTCETGKVSSHIECKE